MKKFKKISTLLIAPPLSFGLLATPVSASPLENLHPEQIQIQVTSTEAVVTKNDLIKKFRDVFPKEFKFLTNSDFHMSSGHYFPEDERVRYDLSFSKRIAGKDIYGSVGFVGENLEIENFHYQPANTADALFPAKISKEEAKAIASNFIKKFNGTQGYKVDDDSNSYPYYMNQTLTEPIRYSFSFVRMENEVPVSDQRIEVSVLGNGEVVSFYRTVGQEAGTFDDIKKMKDKKDLLEMVKDNLSVELQYHVDYDYQTEERNIELVYKPTSKFIGVHALTGEWRSTDGSFTTDLSEDTKLELITPNPLPPKQDGITVEEAKAFAEKLLAVNSDKVKLAIHSIDETTNHNDQDVISIQYMYEYQNGGTGTSLELDKKTGEILQYHDIKSEVLGQFEDKTSDANAISYDSALNQAIEYLKDLAPSHLHHYAKPLDNYGFEDSRGVYHFNFPRVVNGIVVSGDQISVSLYKDGSLNSLNVNFLDGENWPSSEKIISEAKAKATFLEALDLKLEYMKKANTSEEPHYDLVYSPTYNEDSYNLLDAANGEWININQGSDDPKQISHPWAEEELNYLLEANILDVVDTKSFDANKSVSKGEAIEIIIKSLTYIHEGYPPEEEGTDQSFDNIGPDHPLYQVVERAISLGILDPENNKTFNTESSLTREELATWYIRALELEIAAKHSNIYKLGFKDAKQVKDAYKGHVALAASLGLLNPYQDRFNPKKEVSYAELAVSTIQLAHKAFEKER